LVFITEIKSVYSAVRTGPLNAAVCAPSFEGYGSCSKHCMGENESKTRNMKANRNIKKL
jgi:hypothetical protein